MGPSGCSLLHCLYLAFMWQNQHKNTQSSEWRNQTLGSFSAEDRGRGLPGWGAYPITDSNEVKYSLADGGTRQRNGPVQSCSEAPVIQPSVLIKTLCTRSIPVDNRLHSLVEARRVYQRAGESGQIRDRVRAWGQCAYRGQVEWFKGASSRTPPGPRKEKDHRCTHINVLGSHLKGHCLYLPWQEPTKSLALFSIGLPAHSSSQLLVTKVAILLSYKQLVDDDSILLDTVMLPHNAIQQNDTYSPRKWCDSSSGWDVELCWKPGMYLLT